MAYKVFVFLFSLILFHHLVTCASLLSSSSSVSSFRHGQRNLVKDRAQPRRLLPSSLTTVLSANPSNLSAAMNESETSMEASLRKRPPSASNPTQN
ncbi:hypothetical protein L1887_01616 [Cichorium endivia]|nr:hypothetical protein L1887_01616 [Cichorium endivia]